MNGFIALKKEKDATFYCVIAFRCYCAVTVPEVEPITRVYDSPLTISGELIITIWNDNAGV